MEPRCEKFLCNAERAQGYIGMGIHRYGYVRVPGDIGRGRYGHGTLVFHA